MKTRQQPFGVFDWIVIAVVSAGINWGIEDVTAKLALALIFGASYGALKFFVQSRD